MNWFKVRFEEGNPFVNLVKQKLRQWMKVGLPYASFSPYTNDYWKHVRKLLIHRVKLSESRSIECHNPDERFELLYENLVN